MKTPESSRFIRARNVACALGTLLSLAACGGYSDPSPPSDVVVRTEPINGGTSAAAGAWPWSVKVYFNGTFQCGGSLISPDWVLTVAHCLTHAPGTSYSVLLSTGVMVSASTVVMNENFVNDGADSGHFDMGLIRLESPVTAADNVGFIRPAVDGDDVGTTAVAIGWGMTNYQRDSPTLPDQLQQVSLPILSSTTCNGVNLRRHFLYPDELCAGVSGGTKGVCFGDSGSPLMVQRGSGTWEHVGMPSVVFLDPFLQVGCLTYGIFNRTTAMVNWLRQYVPDPAWLPALNLVMD